MKNNQTNFQLNTLEGKTLYGLLLSSGLLLLVTGWLLGPPAMFDVAVETNGGNLTSAINSDGFGTRPYTSNDEASMSAMLGGGPNDICVNLFHDYDNDGSDDGTGEPGFPGLIVTAYDAANIATVLTDNGNGNYIVTPGNADTYRIEVTGLPVGLEPSVVGATTVFFTSRGNTVDVGLHYPAEHYLDAGVFVVMPCYVDGASNGANAGGDVMVVVPTGDLVAGIGNQAPAATYIADHSQIGTTFGVAYSRPANSLFAAAFTKRHSAFGPGGTGAIYKIDLNGTTAPVASTGISTFIDLNSLFGANTAGVDPHPDAGTNFNRDPLAYDAVGKVGLGGLAMSETGNVLWTINLADRRLYEMPLGGTLANPTGPAAGSISRWPAVGDLTDLPGLPGNASERNDNIRPFAVKCYRGDIYIGLVATGESSVVVNTGLSTVTNTGIRSLMRGYVYKFDPTTDVFTQVLDFPLDYAREQAVDFCSNNGQAEFNPWASVYDAATFEATVMGTSGASGSLLPERVYPQPWLTDLEFDEFGRMIIGLRDRFADQHGYNKLPPSMAGSDPNTSFNADAAGDILMASINTTDNTTYVIENNSSNGVNGAAFGPTTGANFGEGPGNGEFFFDDRYRPANAPADGLGECSASPDPNDEDPLLDPQFEQGHDEISLGGLFQYNGNLSTYVAVYDPINDFDNFNQAGVMSLSIQDGSRQGAALVYATQDFDPGTTDDPNTFGKGNGLGDVEGITPPPPIQVGNRLWADTNSNGRQDADEDGINGVLVELFKETAPGVFTKVAETTTAADALQGNGFFIFSNNTNETWINGFTEVEPEMNYEVRISLAAVQAVDGTIGAFTTANTGGVANNNSKTDLNDSDASALGVISFTTGLAGENNHTLDMGVINMLMCSVIGSIVSETCDGMMTPNTGDDTYAIVVTATVTNGSGAYDVLVDGVEATANIASGTSTTITVPASGVTVDITFRDATDDACLSAIVTSSILSPCSPCDVTGSIVSETCDGMNTTSTGDDTYTIVVTATVLNGSGAYDVLVDGVETTANVTSGTSTTITVAASGGTVNISFRDATNDSCISTEITSSAFVACSPTTSPPLPCAGNPGDIGGAVFIDLNNNGASTSEAGQEGIIVMVYDCDGNLVGNTTTDPNGEWTVTGLPDGIDDIYRVEFTFPSNLAYLQPSVHGANNGTDVQFVSPIDCNVDFGVINPADYCPGTPDLATPCFVNGNTTSSMDAFVRFAYNSSGLGQNGIVNLASNNQIGSTIGLAYAREANKFYLGAFLKRHVGLVEGLPGNPLGRVFVKDMNGANGNGTGGVSQFVNLEDYGADVGDISSNAARGLGGLTAPSNDPEAYAKVGKVGLGDVEISADGKFLYVVSLNDQKLFTIEIDADDNPATPPAMGDVASVDIPDPGCLNGAWRPFALKVYNGSVYIGGICDAGENPLMVEDTRLRAYVYRYDGTTFIEVYNYPLTYPKGRAFRENATVGTRWVNWTDVLPSGPLSGSTGFLTLSSMPQPIFSDIEFDRTGAMIIGLMDRYGHQVGQQNYPLSGNSPMISGVISGDILRTVLQANGTYLTESGGISGGITGYVDSPQNYDEGPGGGEFFDDNFFNGARGHGETSYGLMAYHPRLQHLVLNAMDPVDVSGSDQPYFRAGGPLWLNALNGSAIRGFHLYRDGNSSAVGFGKANGLGDLELMCDAVPIEIGNYVWIDTDQDGVQDPCELPVPGLPVTLIDKNTGSVVAVTSTDASGEYYFTETADGVEHDTPYAIVFGYDGNTPGNTVFDETTGIFTIGVEVYELTGANASAEGATDLNDSDASLMTQGSLTDYPIVMYTTADNADHTLDVGLRPVVSFDLALTKVETSAGPYNPGNNVTFTIEVFNQGNVDATDVVVTDYVPAGMIFNAGDNTDFTGATPTATIANIPAGTSATVSIVLAIDPTTLSSLIVNYAEITSFDDDNNPSTAPPEDEDSTPGDNDGDDEIATDGDVDDESSGTPGTMDNPLDEDDYDPASVMVDQPPCDLTIINVDIQCTNEDEFTVSFDVAWDNANAVLDMIEVTIDGDAQPAFTPTGVMGSQSFTMVSISGPAYGLAIEANFLSNTGCATATTFDLIACTNACVDGLGGNVFNDFDNDGADAGAADVAEGNVRVEVYDCDNVLVCETWTNADGDWSCPSLMDNTEEYRVEFSTPLQDNLSPSFAGADNGTNTQFVMGGDCDVDYGVVDLSTACGPAIVENHAIGMLSSKGTLLSSGIAIVTCGIIDDPSISAAEQYTLGLIDIRSIIPANDRPLTNPVDFHHPDWTVTQIGNVYGTTVDNNGSFYATASTHYGAGFGYALGGNNSNLRTSILRYGQIGGGANDVNAAGTIYKMDATTGAPAVFAVLPQQSFSFTHVACEDGTTNMRTTGPGLGNITFDDVHEQFFVSNFEDGIIYRLDENGNILDSFDPQTLTGFREDDGSAGFAQDFKPYGMAVSPMADRLYFGVHPVDNDNTTSLEVAGVYYISLTVEGGFSGTEQFLVNTVPDPTINFDPARGFNAFGADPGWVSVADLHFNPDGNLVIGQRTGCGDGVDPNFASSHNHGATYLIYDFGNASLLNIETRYSGDDGNTGGTGNDDVYGGIGIWDTHDGNYTYVVSSSDIREELGPHGLMVFPHDFTQTGNGTTEYILRPAAAIPYFTNFATNDFKGVGGDAEVYSPCGPVAIQIGNYVWQDDDPNGVQEACEPPIVGLPVNLYTKDDNGDLTLVATTMTGANGEYYFTGDGTNGETWVNTDDVVLTDTTYLIVFGDTPESDTSFVFNNIEYALTTDSTGVGTNPNLNDSDGTFTDVNGNNLPAICYNTADTTDHTLDLGLLPTAVFDLALVKRLDLTTNSGPFGPDSTVTFSIEVYNQGDVDATDIEVKNYMPTGLSLAPASAPDWMISVDTAILMAPLSLSAGDSTTISISFIIDNDFMGDTLSNRAEISSFDDDNDPMTDPPVDEDSTPDDNGSDAPEANTNDEYADDSPGSPGTMDDPADEDDYDFEGISVEQTFDLSLIKTLDTGATPGPFSLGSTVTFAIRVTNQGSLDATEVEVSDYIPEGLTLVPSADWMLEADTARLETPIDLAAGAEVTLSISFTIDNDFMGNRIDNVAEITDFVNALNLPDEDSRPGDNGGDDPEFASDDEEDDDGLNGNGTPDDPTDSDDFDFAPIDIQRFSIGSTVFEDRTNNGIMDDTDAGIPMVTVQLYQVVGAKDDAGNGETDDVLLDVGSDGDLATATDGQPHLTNNRGDYYFSSLTPGDYYVVIPASEFGAAATLEFLNVSSTDIATSTGDNQEDGDDNGLQPGGPAMIICSPVINLATGMEPTDGGALPEDEQGNLQDNAQDANGDMTVDFGLFAPVSVGDTTFVDLDMNGLQSAGDEALPGVTVTLYDSGTMMPVGGNDVNGDPIIPLMTDGMGAYLFDNLPPGDYYVMFDLTNVDNADLYDFTTPNVGGDDALDSDAMPVDPADLMAPSGQTGPLASGETDLTLDAGIVCAIQIAVTDPFTICATGSVDLLTGASVTPARLGAFWTTPDGTGAFVDAAGDPLTAPYELGTAASYLPSAADAIRGFVTLVLTSTDPETLVPTSSCDPVEASVRINILNVDCGQFLWDGLND